MAKFRTQSSCIDLNRAKASWHSLMQKKFNTGQANEYSKTGRKFSNAGWREIAGKKYYLRSKWESNYARYLQWLQDNKNILSWDHEPKTFWFEEIKRGVRSYLPDFLITNLDGSKYWVEVKGYMDAKSLTKIKRFRKYYPNETLEIVDKTWFAKNSKKFSGFIQNWE